MSPPLPPFPSSISPSLSDISPFSSNHFLPFGLLFFLMQLSPFLLAFHFPPFFLSPPILLAMLHFTFIFISNAPFPLFLHPSVMLRLTAPLLGCQLYLLFLLVCSYLPPSFVLIFTDQSAVSSVCDNKILINQYHSPIVITLFSEPPRKWMCIIPFSKHTS